MGATEIGRVGKQKTEGANKETANSGREARGLSV